ncbi:MAG: DEAD/DEAH box helicase family protein [Halanaerobiales bacterium]
MKVKKYIGSTMQDTIFKVKADLGSDAIILNTRKFKKGFLGFFGRTQVEVLAALEEDKPKKEKKIEDKKTLEEINDIKNMINQLNKQWESDSYSRELPDKLTVLYKYLESQGVDIEFRKDFIRKLNKDHYNQDKLIEIAKENMEQFFGKPTPIDSGDTPHVATFVGPTGVGKTTTIAKIAAHYTLDKGMKVALITSDTYRIAAVQQLKTYSDIINIPLQVIYNREELEKAITEKFADYDLILVDTAGSSCNDKIQLGRLKKLISRELIDEIHLIVSMNIKSSDINCIVDQFSLLEPDKIILSKLDETRTYGELINIKYKYDIPYSYITFGQDVPDDIKVAYPSALVKYIMGDINE